MAKKVQLPVIGGIRKVIVPTSGTLIAEFGAGTITLAQLKAALGLTSSTTTTNPAVGPTGATASIQVGPGLSGGGPVVGVVPINLVPGTSPIPMDEPDIEDVIPLPGPAGPIGSQGIPGVPGNDGADGEDGSPGPQGSVGPQGLSGIQGQPGTDGYDGEDGFPGSTGPAGAKGSTGNQGPPGDDGNDGDDGRPGATGPAGATGAIGPMMMAEDGADLDPFMLPPGAPIPLSYGNQFLSSAVPFIIPPSGTMGNNGAFTLGTALPFAYPNCFMWFAAAQIAAGSAAGWYFTQMSSTTAATVFNNTYVSGLPTFPTGTPFVTTGPGAITGSTSFQSMASLTLPGGLMGVNGVLRVTSLWNTPNNADTKTLTVRYAGTNLLNTGVSTVNSVHVMTVMYNRQSQAVNVAFPAANNTGLGIATTAAANQLTLNTAAAQTLLLGGQLAVATDFIVLEGWNVEVFHGP